MILITASEKSLSYKGDAEYALLLVESLHTSYGGEDMPKMLSDFVFNIEVALQDANVLDQDFNLINTFDKPYTFNDLFNQGETSENQEIDLDGGLSAINE